MTGLAAEYAVHRPRVPLGATGQIITQEVSQFRKVTCPISFYRGRISYYHELMISLIKVMYQTTSISFLFL